MKLLSRIALAIVIVACIGAGIFAFKLGGIRDGLRKNVANLTTEKNKLTKDLADTRTDLTNTKQDLTKTQDELTNTKGELEAGKVALASKTQEADKLQKLCSNLLIILKRVWRMPVLVTSAALPSLVIRSKHRLKKIESLVNNSPVLAKMLLHAKIEWRN